MGSDAPVGRGRAANSSGVWRPTPDVVHVQHLFGNRAMATLMTVQRRHPQPAARAMSQKILIHEASHFDNYVMPEGYSLAASYGDFRQGVLGLVVRTDLERYNDGCMGIGRVVVMARGCAGGCVRAINKAKSLIKKMSTDEEADLRQSRRFQARLNHMDVDDVDTLRQLVGGM